jgi:hypothetical protein
VYQSLPSLCEYFISLIQLARLSILFIRYLEILMEKLARYGGNGNIVEKYIIELLF